MCNLCVEIVNRIWNNLIVGQMFRTPDLYIGKNYQITAIENNKISIAPQNIKIARESFEKAIHYLKTNEHYVNNPCEIRSNNDRYKAGPLCIASRDANQNVRCINYIVPILQAHRIVEIDSNRPNKTWLIL